MSETREGQTPNPEQAQNLPRRFAVKLRGPVFDYIADKAAPVYLAELNKLKQDGAYKPLTDFFDSPFSKVVGRILDRIDKNPRSPEVLVFDFSQDEFDAIIKRIPEETNFVRSRISRELREEFKGNFRDAKFAANLKSAVKAVSQKIKRRRK